jgi:DNA repair exonuclease SbcCD ATPase subunit
MTDDDRKRLETLERDVRAVRRDLETLERRIRSEVTDHTDSLADALKRHVDLSNASSLAPYTQKLSHIEAQISSLLVSRDEQAKLAKRMTAALEKRNAIDEAAEALKKEQRESQELIRQAAESKSRTRTPYLVFAAAVLTVISGLGGACAKSHADAPTKSSITK